MGVYIWDKFNDYSAMQWPCSTGFHVPINTEWTTVIDDWVTIWAWAISWWTSDMSSKLKLPIAWTYGRTGSLSNRWSVAEYWCCNQYTSDTYWYAIYLTSSQINKTFGEMKSCWLPVRPFKDEIVVPDSTWTTIHDWSWIAPWAWIFRNSTLWLISISADWTNWTTIGDKNLWATEVWSSWTLTAENTWTYFQRWNNYWFPFAWWFTTSWTRVDASTYWPWNYYYWTTYITTSSPNDWSSVRVPNLRWWVTWVVISSKELKNAYIGEYTGRLPSEYQEVEYIESSGTQYIKTWFSYSQTTWEVKAKFIPTALWGNYYTYRLGGAYNWSNRSFIMYNAYSSAYIWLGGSDYNQSITVTANTLYEVDAKIETAWTCLYNLNWTTKTISYSWSIATNKEYYIFCNNENWSAGNYWKYKVYYYQIYEAWTLVRDFVPCYRIADSVIWMYDLVNDVFYTNSWSWTFSKWADV